MKTLATLVRTGLILGMIGAAATPSGSEMGRDLEDGFVGCSTSDDCFPFDLTTYETGAPLELLPEGNYPYDATMTPDGSEVWFVGASGDGAVVVDRATNTITHRIPTGEYPTSIAFSDDGALALVSCRDTEEVTVINTETYLVEHSLPLPAGYDGGNIALDPISKSFYLVDWYDNTLFEIASDGSEILRQVDIGNSLWQLVVSPDGETVYVTDRGADRVRIIARASLEEIGSVPVGDDPWGLDITADGGKLVVTCEDSHDVWIIDTETLATSTLALDAAADPRDVDILDAQQRAFVCGGTVGTSDPIYVIDLVEETILTSFEANGTNTNVIAVQAQVHSGASAVIADEPRGRRWLGLRAGPNPVRFTTDLRYLIPEAAVVEIAIFDARGRMVRLLEHGRRSAGTHQVLWDRLDGARRELPAGVYYVRLDAGRFESRLKLVLTR